MNKAVSLGKWQRKVLILCWCAYASAYLSRTNISIALPGMMVDQGWNKASVGLIGTAFFWAYAFGQLINGFLGDKIKSRQFIFTGLCVSSFINLMVGFSTNLVIIIILWGCNGFFLSTLWGPIVKTISIWFPERRRTRVAVIISISMVGGYLAAWGIIGQIIARVTWRWAFWLPAILVFIFSLVWLVKMRSQPEESGFEADVSLEGNNTLPVEPENKVSFIHLILETRLWLVALTCITQGIIKDGISLWAPTFLTDTQHLSPELVSFFSLAIPVTSLFGILCAGWLNTIFNSNEKKAILVLVTCSASCSVLLLVFLHLNTYIVVLLLSLTIALMYGANTLLLTIIPIKYAKKYNKVSSVAGFLDFSSYMGATAAGVLTGVILDYAGWKYVIMSWIAMALLGIVFIYSARNRKESNNSYNTELCGDYKILSEKEEV